MREARAELVPDDPEAAYVYIVEGACKDHFTMTRASLAERVSDMGLIHALAEIIGDAPMPQIAGPSRPSSVSSREGPRQAGSLRGRTMPCNTFLKAHWGAIAAADFFSVEVLSVRGLVR